MKAVLIGTNKELLLEDVARPSLKRREVLISVRATGINCADLLQRRGLYPPPSNTSAIMGLECAGVVEALGDDAKRFQIGDRVCAFLAGGGYAEYASVDEGSVFPIPGNLKYEEAACFPEAMMTVWANVFLQCNFQAGESLLVYGGTSRVGVMAIQMSKVAKAGAIFATAGTGAKCAISEKLGASKAINYNTADFAKIIIEHNRVDVILDLVGGNYVQMNIDIVRSEGRICNIAYQNGHHVSLNLLKLMLKRAFLTGRTLRTRSVHEKRVIKDAVEKEFWPAVEVGDIRPVLDSRYSLSAVEFAHEKMRSGKHVGKIVLPN